MICYIAYWSGVPKWDCYLDLFLGFFSFVLSSSKTPNLIFGIIIGPGPKSM